MNYLQAWSYTEAMASVAPGLGLGALQKFLIDFKILKCKGPLQIEKWLCPFNMFKNEVLGLPNRDLVSPLKKVLQTY